MMLKDGKCDQWEMENMPISLSPPSLVPHYMNECFVNSHSIRALKYASIEMLKLRTHLLHVVDYLSHRAGALTGVTWGHRGHRGHVSVGPR